MTECRVCLRQAVGLRGRALGGHAGGSLTLDRPAATQAASSATTTQSGDQSRERECPEANESPAAESINPSIAGACSLGGDSVYRSRWSQGVEESRESKSRQECMLLIG